MLSVKLIITIETAFEMSYRQIMKVTTFKAVTLIYVMLTFKKNPL